jgi:hypothetical protein
MKKIFLLLFALSTVLLSAAESPIFTGLKGSYAIYEDSRYGDTVYIGVCYVGDDTIIMRSYEPASGNDFAIKGSFNNVGGLLDYESDMRILKGEIKSSEAATRLLPQMLNWANTWFNLKENIGTETQYNGNDGYSFSFWIPVFQLSSIGRNQGLKLITTGIAHSERDPEFLDFKGLPRAGYAPSYTIKKAEPFNAEIDGISIPLDKNWDKIGETRYGISQFSDEDALFEITTSRPAETGIHSTATLVTLHMLAQKEQRLLAEGSRVFITDGIFNLVKRSLDENTGRIYLHQMQFLPRGNGYVSVAELKVLETVYLKNKAYFNAILY